MSTYKIVMQHKNTDGVYDTLLPKSYNGSFINISTIAGSTLTVTGPNNYNQTYTLSSSEDTHGFAITDDGNYTLKVVNGNKSSSKVVTVNNDGIFYYILYPFSSVLNNNTWEEISQASSLDIASSLWNIGDVKMDIINGTVGNISMNGNYGFYIIDFDHNSKIEGKGISFMGFKTNINNGTDICLVDTNYFGASDTGFIMSSVGNNKGGWESSYIRKTIIPQFRKILPLNLQQSLKLVAIYSDNIGGIKNESSQVTVTLDTIYLASAYEIWGNGQRENYSESDYQTQFSYYKKGASKVKYKQSSPSSQANWWTRSASYSSESYFIYVSEGYSGTGNANLSFGFAPIFKI